MEKIRVYMDDPETGQRKYGSVTVDKLSVALAKGFKVAEQQAAAPPAAASAPAPSPTAPAAPAASMAAEVPAVPAEEGGGFPSGLNALLTGAGRGATFDFLDELRGAAAAAGGQIGGRLAGVPAEFLAQEDFYTQGREEEQARQRKLEEESPLLTMAGQVAGALPYAALAPAAPAAAPATLGARFAQAAPAAAAYGALSGVGQTDIKSPEGPSADVPLDLAKNIAISGGAGVLGAAGGAALGTAASRVRELIARKLASIGEKADEARVLTAGKKALKAAEKEQGGVDVKEVARVMREPGVALGGVRTPADIFAKGKDVKKEAGTLISRIVSDVDAASGGFLRKAQDARAQAAQIAEQIDSAVAQKEAAADDARRLVSAAAEKLERAREAQNISVLRGGKRAMTKPEAMQILQSHAMDPEAIDPVAVTQARSVVSMPAGSPAPTDNAAYNQMLAKLKADVDDLTKKADAASREVIASRNTDQSKLIADLTKQADEAEAAAAKRKVSAKTVSDRVRSEAEQFRAGQGGAFQDPASKAKYEEMLRYADEFAAAGDVSMSQAQEKLKALGKVAKFDKGAKDIDVESKAQAAREQNRAIREQMTAAASETLPPGSSSIDSALARIGKGQPLAEAPSGGEALQSARRVYDVMQDIVPSAKEEAKRLAELPFMSRLKQSYEPSLKASGRELAGRLPPKAREMLVPTQERILRSLPYGAESFAEMLRQIDEEAAQ
jgi:hypothetical protein